MCIMTESATAATHTNGSSHNNNNNTDKRKQPKQQQKQEEKQKQEHDASFAASASCTSTTIRDDDEDMMMTIPWLCRCWLSATRSLPHCRLGGMEWNVTVTCLLLFSCVKLAVEYCLTTYFDWPAADDPDTSWGVGSIVALLHSLQLVPILSVLFWNCRQYHPAAAAAVEPAWWYETADAALQFCIAYMVQDTFWVFVVGKWTNGSTALAVADYLFLGHHAATAFYMTAVRVQRAGHQSAMMCMLVGEVTNPIHNVYYFLQTVLKLFGGGTNNVNLPVTGSVFAAVDVLFSLQYCFTRVIIAPPLMAHITYNLWKTGRCSVGGLLPTWMVITFIFLIWLVVLGSYPWIASCWQVLQETAAAAMSPLMEQQQHDAEL